MSSAGPGWGAAAEVSVAAMHFSGLIRLRDKQQQWRSGGVTGSGKRIWEYLSAQSKYLC